MKKIWFRRKLYGWGWTPSTWQGVLLTLVYLAFIITIAFTINKTASDHQVVINFVIPFVVATVVFLTICYKTGETPRWQWGNRVEDSKQL